MTNSGETLATEPLGEPFGERQFYDFLNFAGNHELKLLTGAVILTQPDTKFSAYSLRRALFDYQAEDTGWNITPSVVASYCLRSLEPSGAVAQTKIQGERGKPVPAFEAIPTHSEARLAHIGTLLGWSLKYPNISVQQTFGMGARSGTQVRSPEMRYRIYAALLTDKDGGTVPDIFASLEGRGYSKRESMNAQLSRMKELGLVNVRTTTAQNPPMVVKHMPFQTFTNALEASFTVAQAAYMAIKQQAEGQITSIDEIVETAVTISPTLDAAALRAKLFDSVIVRGYPGLKLLEGNQNRSTVTLAPAAKAPIQTLYERLEAAKAGDRSGLQVVEQVLSHHDAFRSLVAKARRFSTAR